MSAVKVRNVTIGEGIPKICVPIVGKERAEILAAAEEMVTYPVDVVEWRVDHYVDCMQTDSVIETAKILRQLLKDMPILFTFRTAGEGGEREISWEDYKTLNLAIADSKMVDLVDVEVFLQEGQTSSFIAELQQKGVKVVASNHDFHKTPQKKEILRRLMCMQEMGADIPKIAVMPQSKEDVLTLLSATLEMSQKHGKTPIITMSMAKDGMISRFTGEIFGSALTFGAVKQTSAPGQMDVSALSEILQKLHV